MNLRTLIRSVAAWSLLLTGASAQQMPQDNWRFDNLQFSAPGNPTLGSIAIGSGGVYVEQATNPVSIAQFQESGVFVRQFGSFTDIVGIACDSAGNVYAVNAGDRKVKAYSSTGTFLREWGGTGTTDGLFGAMSGSALITIDRNDQVYVCDPGNQRVQVFDASGNFLRKWGDPGSLPGQFGANYPQAIAAAANGWVYVRGSSFGQTVVFDSQGNYLKHANGFTYPYGLGVSPDGLIAGSSFSNIPNSAGVSLLSQDLAAAAFVPTNVAGSFAFNARGDFFQTSNTVVRVYEREYEGVQNSLLPPGLPQPMVLSSAQRDGTAWLDVDYKVTDVDSATVSTAGAAFINGGNLLASIVPMKTFREGTAANIGAGIPTGVTKRITWDMAADWSVDFAQIQVEMLAKDNRNPLGIHWITIPAENGNPAIQVSKAPITDDQLRSLWFWFIASGHPKVSKANGSATLLGAAGSGYAGLTLASDSGTSVNTTSFGFGLACEQLGIRAMSPAEITRALAGSYGFTSVTADSVVREAGMTTQVVVSWGHSSYAGVPALVQSAGVTKIAASATSSNNAAVKSDGTVLQWDGATLSSAPAGLTGVQSVAVGGSHFMAVKTNGTLWAWGTNGSGQLGLGDTTTRTTPVQVGAATDWAAVACGGSHTLALKTNGTLWAWGGNSSGQLGDGTSTQRTSPVQIGIATDWASVSCGDSYTLARKTSNTLWAWGGNSQGQLGIGDTTARNAPVQVGTATDWTSASCGTSHTAARKSNGTIWAWGRNAEGQLGNGTTTQSNSPVQSAGTGWLTVACGGSFTVGLKTDGTVGAWSSNGSGQTIIPAGLSGVTAIAVGGSHSLALRPNP